jgi:hypothetical protein
MKFLAAMMTLVFIEIVLTVSFIFGILMGKWDNLVLGTILAAEFFVLALVLICYVLMMLPPLEIAEDRDKGLLW